MAAGREGLYMFKALKNFFSGKNDQESAEKAAIASIESQLSRMLQESVTVETRSVDPDENIATPKGAEINYLDARALEFWDGRRTDYEIPSYYSESAFERTVGPALKRLLHGGYLDIGDIAESINLKKVPELKAILKDKKLKVSGNKPELVHRLINNLDSDELNELFSVSVYHITEKGNLAIEPYSIIFDSQHYALGFSTYRLLQEKQRNLKSSNEGILTKLLLEDTCKAVKSGNEPEYRSLVSKTSRYLRECGQYQGALEYGILAYFMWFHEAEKDELIRLAGNGTYLATSIDNDGQKCGFTFNQLVSFFNETLRKHNPFGLCTKQDIQKAVDSFKKSISMQ